MAKIMMIHPERCSGCKRCERACALAHGGIRRTGASRVHAFSWKSEEDGTRFSVPMMCRQCSDAACVKICPTGAMRQSADGLGIVELDQQSCIGCKLCVQVCPFGNVHFDSVDKVIAKCDTCAGAPHCVEMCINGALEFVDDGVQTGSRRRAFAERFKDALTETA